jgi:carboxypeptidase C (cathepsin A)
VNHLKAKWLPVLLAGISILFGTTFESLAEEKKNEPAPAKDEKAEKKEGKHEPKEELVNTSHRVTIQGREIEYQATAGTILLKQEDDKPKVSFFFIAYTRTNITNIAERPITFSFNGGPGSSSVWLHLGVLGPKRVFLKEDGSLPPPPFKLVDNDFSLLDQTDLVFIDPVSTGFSRAVPGEDPKKYHGVDEDIASVAEFIRLYTTRNKRWSSPKFLIGESYGTTRAAGLSGVLQGSGMYLNGIMLLSSVLNFATISFNVGNDLPYVVFLPSYAATAWYHKKLPADLQGKPLAEVLAEVEKFAAGEYATGLFQGNQLSIEDRRKLANRVARYTGLSETFVDQTHLRIEMAMFAKELLRDQGRTVGRFDSRYLGLDRLNVGDSPDHDPSFTAVIGPFSSTMNDYARTELKFESDLPYEILTGSVQPWNFGAYRNRYVNVAETLRSAMHQNPYLKVFVGSGYYDLATPFFGTRYTMDHLDLSPTLSSNLVMAYYPAGHMMYVHQPSLELLRKDLAAFITGASR